jgi:hypothetical protein
MIPDAQRFMAPKGERPQMIEELAVGQLYSNEEIFKSLKVSNAGGIRLSLQGKAVLRAAIMTSVEDFHGVGENPYHDRLEGGILTYTAAGKTGQQTLAGANNRAKDIQLPDPRICFDRQQKGQVRRREALEVSGAARIPPPLPGHATRRRSQGAQGMAFRI